MDNKITTSFIPKQTINSKLTARREPLGIATAVAAAVLVLAIVFFAIVFGYRFVVYGQIYEPCPETGGGECGLKASLEREIRDFDYDNLTSLKRLDTKLKLGKDILYSHSSIKPLFNKLSELTAHNIKFTKFEFKEQSVGVSGVAKSYEDIAFQSQILKDELAKKGEQKKLLGYAFSDFDLDTDGNVLFRLSLSLDPSLLLFVKNIDLAYE